MSTLWYHEVFQQSIDKASVSVPPHPLDIQGVFLTGTPLKMSLGWHPLNLLGLAVSLNFISVGITIPLLDTKTFFNKGGWLLIG